MHKENFFNDYIVHQGKLSREIVSKIRRGLLVSADGKNELISLMQIEQRMRLIKDKVELRVDIEEALDRVIEDCKIIANINPPKGMLDEVIQAKIERWGRLINEFSEDVFESQLLALYVRDFIDEYFVFTGSYAYVPAVSQELLNELTYYEKVLLEDVRKRGDKIELHPEEYRSELNDLYPQRWWWYIQEIRSGEFKYPLPGDEDYRLIG